MSNNSKLNGYMDESFVYPTCLVNLSVTNIVSRRYVYIRVAIETNKNKKRLKHIKHARISYIYIYIDIC